jgi:hypothetical protein
MYHVLYKDWIEFMKPFMHSFQIFRRLMKGKFDAYVLWPLAKKFQNWIVDRSTARDFTVRIIVIHYQYYNSHSSLSLGVSKKCIVFEPSLYLC